MNKKNINWKIENIQHEQFCFYSILFLLKIVSPEVISVEGTLSKRFSIIWFVNFKKASLMLSPDLALTYEKINLCFIANFKASSVGTYRSGERSLLAPSKITVESSFDVFSIWRIQLFKFLKDSILLIA